MSSAFGGEIFLIIVKTTMIGDDSVLLDVETGAKTVSPVVSTRDESGGDDGGTGCFITSLPSRIYSKN